MLIPSTERPTLPPRGEQAAEGGQQAGEDEGGT